LDIRLPFFAGSGRDWRNKEKKPHQQKQEERLYLHESQTQRSGGRCITYEKSLKWDEFKNLLGGCYEGGGRTERKNPLNFQKNGIWDLRGGDDNLGARGKGGGFFRQVTTMQETHGSDTGNGTRRGGNWEKGFSEVRKRKESAKTCTTIGGSGVEPSGTKPEKRGEVTARIKENKGGSISKYRKGKNINKLRSETLVIFILEPTSGGEERGDGGADGALDRESSSWGGKSGEWGEI